MRKLAAVLLSALMLMTMTGCSQPTSSDGEDMYDILPDSHFEQGFVLTGFDSRPEYNQRDIGRIDYGEEGLEPMWRVGQWGCLANLAYDGATYTQEDGFDVFRDDKNSKTLKVNRTTGAFSLNIDATADGVYADGPRENNEPWPHFILEVPQFPEFLMLKDTDFLTFYLEFTLNKSENHCGEAYDPGLHSAMFLWYVTVADVTDTSQYFWFGLPIYDNRKPFSDEFAAQDGGKEDSTDAFIYNPAGNTFLDMPVTVGVPNLLSRDMLPTIYYAFDLAQQRGFMQNTKKENLCITLMYIGWELPGTFDVGIDVHKMNLFAGKN